MASSNRREFELEIDLNKDLERQLETFSLPIELKYIEQVKNYIREFENSDRFSIRNTSIDLETSKVYHKYKFIVHYDIYKEPIKLDIEF